MERFLKQSQSLIQIASRQLFIQTATTPNPSCLKFSPGKSVTGDSSQTIDYSSIRNTSASPLARQLFQIVGVTRVFYGKDFISVTKKEEEDWKILKPEVLSVITEHYTRGQPLLLEDVVEPEDTKITEADSESVAMIKEIIQTRVRPFVQEDGGDLRFVSFDLVSGLVLVEMKGSCAGCPSSAVTLKNGIENMLRHYVDEVKELKAIDAQ